MAFDWTTLAVELRDLHGVADRLGVLLEEAGEDLGGAGERAVYVPAVGEFRGDAVAVVDWSELRSKVARLAELAEDVSVRSADLVNMIDPDTGD